MNGLEIAEAYYREYGEPMLREKFPELLPLVAAGLCGSGSECFGYDDLISRDHDFEPGFCLFLPGEEVVDRRTAFLLERAYAGLPRQYMGAERTLAGPVGGARRGILRTSDFFLQRTGSADGCLTAEQWLHLPDHALAEAVNGKIFFDGYGEVSRIRGRLRVYPPDIRLKKLAGNLLLMAQSGQYNYMRCIGHGERAAAQLAAAEFVRSAMQAVFLLNNVYMPFYKWSFRALRSLPVLSLHAELFEYLLTTDNEDGLAQSKLEVIEGIASDVAEELVRQGLVRERTGVPAGLERCAYLVNDGIADPEIRNMHILEAV